MESGGTPELDIADIWFIAKGMFSSISSDLRLALEPGYTYMPPNTTKPSPIGTPTTYWTARSNPNPRTTEYSIPPVAPITTAMLVKRNIFDTYVLNNVSMFDFCSDSLRSWNSSEWESTKSPNRAFAAAPDVSAVSPRFSLLDTVVSKGSSSVIAHEVPCS
jgi:hypothetical protein